MRRCIAQLMAELRGGPGATLAVQHLAQLVLLQAFRLHLVVDSGRDLERAVTRNPGEKTSAMDVGRTMPEPAARMSMQDRVARDPSLDLTALRVPVEPKAPDLPFPEKDISLEM